VTKPSKQFRDMEQRDSQTVEKMSYRSLEVRASSINIENR